MTRTAITLAELAARVGATLEGDGGVVVSHVSALETAGADAICFLSHPKYRPLLAGTRAGAVILTADNAPLTTIPKLVGANPYAVYAKVATILHPATPHLPGIDATARVAKDAVVDATASIGAYAVIDAHVTVGARAVIGPHSYLGEGAVIGDDVHLVARVTLYPRTVLGARTVVHAGAVIGSDGFGLAEDHGHWLKIPQVGRAIVGADCEIGANTTIDRGAVDDTVIEDGVKLDNQIQVGHNCRIGAHTAIAGCVGIAGSANIGRSVRIGGAAMIAGHLSIADGSTVAAGTLVISSIKEPGAYNGSFPLMTQRDWSRAAVELRHLHTLARRVAALERALRAQPGAEEGS